MSVFDKQLEPWSPPKEGGLKIAIISDFNIAGQPTFLMRALNRYTPHRARTIVWKDDYMRYDRDIVFSTQEGVNTVTDEELEEARQIVKEADFFHFGRLVFDFPGVKFEKILNPNNAVVKYYGSELRLGNKARIRRWHRETGIRAITGLDWTMSARVPGFYHLASYFTRYGDMAAAEIPRVRLDDEHCIVCAGSGTSGIKGYDILDRAIAELAAEGVPVKTLRIQGLPNSAALEARAQGHITFSSLHQGWGISGIEAMWMGQAVLTNLDPFILSLYPDQPAVLVDRANLKDRLRQVVQNRDLREHLAIEGRDFVARNFQNRDIVRRYCYLIDLIMRSEDYEKGNQATPRIYSA